VTVNNLFQDDPGVEPIERASRDELAALQLRRLRRTLDHVFAHVPHYRAALGGVGYGPGGLSAPDDLRHLPFTTKEDLRQGYPFGLFAVPREEVLRLHASSGTTGRATVVGYTRRDLETWTRLMARSLRAAGVRAGDVMHLAFGYGLFTGGLGFHQGAETLGCTVVPASGGMTARQVTLIEDFGATAIGATPSYMLTILDEYRAQGRDPGHSPLRVGVFGAEPWSEAMRAEIEGAFGLRAMDCYGLSELIGPGVAVEIDGARDGLHLWEDHFYPEIIDPETGAVLPDGEYGELVLTSLTREAMPVIRYRTRDLTRLLPGTARPMRRIERIRGRSDDMIILRGVNVFPSQIEAELLSVPGLAPHFQIELARDGRMDRLTVHAEASQPVEEDGRRALESALTRRIRQALGLSVATHVGPPGMVPRSEGKALRVVDRRPGDRGARLSPGSRPDSPRR
jgi:phenylacetate-CoA ligase